MKVPHAALLPQLGVMDVNSVTHHGKPARRGPGSSDLWAQQNVAVQGSALFLSSQAFYRADGLLILQREARYTRAFIPHCRMSNPQVMGELFWINVDFYGLVLREANFT